MKKELIVTADGSNSIYLSEMDEHYHSKHGAIKESEHIFIQAGLLEMAKVKDDFKIFEVGMGTGLNALMSIVNSEKLSCKISYKSIEAYPLEWTLLKNLNYADLLGAKEYLNLFKKIHQAEWGQEVVINTNFSLEKIHGDLLTYKFSTFIDLIYFDAFAPEKQEEMWSVAIFEKLYAALNFGGMLVTYCVKGEVRRRLQSIGFSLEKLPGPKGGKREMLRAWKR